MAKIDPDQIYTPQEAQDFLRVSSSTIKRFLKKGIIRANKVGGRYKILGREILKLVLPKAEVKGENFYKKIKEKTRNRIKNW